MDSIMRAFPGFPGRSRCLRVLRGFLCFLGLSRGRLSTALRGPPGLSWACSGTPGSSGSPVIYVQRMRIQGGQDVDSVLSFLFLGLFVDIPNGACFVVSSCCFLFSILLRLFLSLSWLLARSVLIPFLFCN